MYSDSSSNVLYQGLSHANAINKTCFMHWWCRESSDRSLRKYFSKKRGGLPQKGIFINSHRYIMCLLNEVHTHTLVENMSPNMQDLGTVWLHAMQETEMGQKVKERERVARKEKGKKGLLKEGKWKDKHQFTIDQGPDSKVKYCSWLKLHFQSKPCFVDFRSLSLVSQDFQKSLVGIAQTSISQSLINP